MNRVPPEIDRLMWAVAENPLPDAMDEFGQRYPDFRGELLKRVEMVRGLRNEVKGSGYLGQQIPKFEPRPSHSAVPPRGLYFAFGLGVVAIAFAAFTAIMSLESAPIPKTLVVPVKINKPLAVPPLVYRPSPPVVENPPSNPPPVIDPPNPAPIVPLSEKRRDLALKDVQILDALTLITAGTNLKLEIAPGFVNQKVTLHFHDLTTSEMLREMGKEYAFTVSDEGDHMLVLPVPDNESEEQGNLATHRRIGP